MIDRYARLGAKALKANFTRLDAPLKLNFAVTYWCQYRCKTCNIWKKKPTDELTTDEILDFIRVNRDFSWVDVTGGEIFLRKDIRELLEAMVRTWKQLLIFHFATNGFQTSTIVPIVKNIASLSKAEIVITVSLDGDEALNDEIRGIKGGYQAQMETFREIRKIPGVRAILGMTLSRDNLGTFERTFESCRTICPDLTIADFHLNVMQLSDHYYSNSDTDELAPSREEARGEIAKYRALRGRPSSPSTWLEDRFLGNLDTFLETGRTPMRCHSLRSSCFIDPWGTVYPCITYSRPVGRLRETGMDLAPIWKGQTATQLQKEIWDYDCPECWTACEAYQSILGNVLRPDHRGPAPDKPSGEAGRLPVVR